jgi:hypothetical protein
MTAQTKGEFCSIITCQAADWKTMPKRTSLTESTILDLLGLYSDILIELCERGVLRSVNNPAADYAEYLVAKALHLTPAPKSTKGYDAVGQDGKRYEIKARRLTRRSRPTRFSAIRKLEENHFDFLVAVLFDEHFFVQRALVLPREHVTRQAFWQAHVNGWILPISDDF